MNIGTPPEREAYLRLADTIRMHLKTGVLARWFPACVDSVAGGFWPSFTELMQRGTDNSKFLVHQGRMTWVAANVALRSAARHAEFRAHAQHGVKFLAEVMWDKQHGGLFFALDERGRISGRFGSEKHAYGTAFGIYGAAAAYAATKDPVALDLARHAFEWFDAHAHDAANGGYFEALTREGKPILAPAAARKTDGIGTTFGYKSMNSHIHLLEALTELYVAAGGAPTSRGLDRQIEARLHEIFLIVRDKVVVPPGCTNLYFTPDWRPAPGHDSFGHDVQTAYLLLEASKALKDPDGARSMKVARSLVDHALEYGWDAQHGGFYGKGGAFSAAYGLEKVWWTQAEGLNALMLMHEKFRGETDRYWRAFLKQWEFIWRYQIDHRNGEWFETVSRDGKAEPGRAKGHIWKAAYHNGRALMNVSHALRNLAR